MPGPGTIESRSSWPNVEDGEAAMVSPINANIAFHPGRCGDIFVSFMAYVLVVVKVFE